MISRGAAPSRTFQRSRAVSALLLVLAMSAGACSAVVPPNGNLPCDATIDSQRAAGFDVALEATLPVAGWERTPTQVDSGRECSPARLGPLWGAGIRELRSAGAIFDNADQTGYTLVSYRATGLSLEALSYAFERGARGGRKTQDVRVEPDHVGDWPASRLTLINGDHGQVIVLFANPAEAPLIRGVLTSDLPKDEVDRIVAAFAAALRK